MTDDHAWAEYSTRFRREVLPHLLDSACFLSIGSERSEEFDVKQATEIGAAILCDKPFMLVIPKGRRVSQRLRRVADIIIDEWDAESTDAQERIAEALRVLGTT